MNNEKELIYEPNSNEINDLLSQIDISESDAMELLKLKQGNIVECILSYYENIDNKSYKDELNNKQDLDELIKENEGKENVSDIEQINILRRILNEKDVIFQEKVSKEIDTDGKEKFTFINFDNSTDTFKKNTTHSDRNTLLDTQVKSYLNASTIPIEILQKHDELKDKQLLCKFIGKNAKKMINKWGLERPAIFYYNNQVVDKSKESSEKYKNEFATKLLLKSENIKNNEILVGPVSIVNKWF